MQKDGELLPRDSSSSGNSLSAPKMKSHSQKRARFGLEEQEDMEVSWEDDKV